MVVTATARELALPSVIGIAQVNGRHGLQLEASVTHPPEATAIGRVDVLVDLGKPFATYYKVVEVKVARSVKVRNLSQVSAFSKHCAQVDAVLCVDGGTADKPRTVTEQTVHLSDKIGVATSNTTEIAVGVLEVATSKASVIVEQVMPSAVLALEAPHVHCRVNKRPVAIGLATAFRFRVEALRTLNVNVRDSVRNCQSLVVVNQHVAVFC